MRKSVLWVSMAVLCLTLLNVAAMAQNSSMHDPPKILNIIREEVKTGKAFAHDQNETAWLQAFVKANYTTPMLTVSAVTGPAEDWFIVGYDSFAALEKENQQMTKNAAYRNINMTYGSREADLISESRTITARFRPELSYKPAINVGEYRYFSIAVIRFRLGEDVDAYYKTVNAAREKAGLDAHIAIYAVNSGMPSGTYLSFSPIKSLAQWDDPPNEALTAALKEINWGQMVAKSVLNAESRLYAFSPSKSNPSPEMVAASPDFWKPKAVMAKKSTGEVTPAAKKETARPADKK